MSALRIVSFLFLAPFLSSCATSRKEQTVEAPLKKPEVYRLVGVISTVNREHGFVLIHSNDLRPAGSSLMTLPSQEGVPQAHLRVSREQRPPFLIADIMEGIPSPGESVVDAPITAPVVVEETLSGSLTE